MDDKVRSLLERFKEVETLLGQPETVQDQEKYRALTQEHAYLFDLSEAWHLYEHERQELENNRALLQKETDPEFLEMIREEISSLEKSIPKSKSRVETLLVPPDPRDNANIIMEIRAGTGGDEAALFVGDCVRLYQLYADKMKWKTELLTCTPSDVGGYKEYIMVVAGKNVFRMMQYEGGTHRVQRVPATETQGRVHTSAITIAIIMEPGEEEAIHVDEKDLKIDTYRASGAGGQHVNTTDSAVRITHMPTGVVVYCQEERSQHKNKDKAMRVLKAKLVEEQRRKQQEEIAELRAGQVGTGDRSERIRTYNFPQNRITDHRINLTLYKLDQVMEGELAEITEALVTHFHEQKFK